MSSREPAQIGLLLSASWIPALNQATEILRERNPKMTEGELLELIFLTGCIATRESEVRRSRKGGTA